MFWTNSVFSFTFLLELIAKNIALGPRAYVQDPWNRFDAAVVGLFNFRPMLKAPGCCSYHQDTRLLIPENPFNFRISTGASNFAFNLETLHGGGAVARGVRHHGRHHHHGQLSGHPADLPRCSRLPPDQACQGRAVPTRPDPIYLKKLGVSVSDSETRRPSRPTISGPC